MADCIPAVYVLERNGRFVMGTRAEVVRQAGAKLVGRVLCIEGVRHYTYGDSFTDRELAAEAVKDSMRLLVNNHRWRAFKELDWRTS